MEPFGFPQVEEISEACTDQESGSETTEVAVVTQPEASVIVVE